MALTDDAGPGEPGDAPGGAGRPVATRVAPVLTVVALGWLLRQFLRRRNPRPRRRGSKNP